MTDFAQIEKDVLELTPAQRERLALQMWERLIEGEEAIADSSVDPDGIKLLFLVIKSRDRELETKPATSISHEEFLDRTSGK